MFKSFISHLFIVAMFVLQFGCAAQLQKQEPVITENAEAEEGEKYNLFEGFSLMMAEITVEVRNPEELKRAIEVNPRIIKVFLQGQSESNETLIAKMKAIGYDVCVMEDVTDRLVFSRKTKADEEQKLAEIMALYYLFQSNYN